MAEGTLPICIGGATRLIEFIGLGDAGRVGEQGPSAAPASALPYAKAYDCAMRLGVTTDTLDVWGGVTAESGGADLRASVTPERVREVFATMTGDVEQTPPAYSAIKYKGRKLYEYARRGEAIPPEALRPRRVHIESIDVTDFLADEEDAKGGPDEDAMGFATVKFSVVCSGGTYVRAIVRDAGEALGCGAAMSALTRTRSGVFTLADAHTAKELERAAESGAQADMILPPDAAISFMPTASLDEAAAAKFVNGQKGDGSFLSSPSPAAPRYVRAYCGARFLGVGKVADDIISPCKVIAS
jgi:tRNA pseudouridine55 synthase